jgi:hypothetical protein
VIIIYFLFEEPQSGQGVRNRLSFFRTVMVVHAKLIYARVNGRLSSLDKLWQARTIRFENCRFVKALPSESIHRPQ